ncbi:MAG: helix-hairpin-helix domain-containing protein [Streptosporangiales bacterium]
MRGRKAADVDEVAARVSRVVPAEASGWVPEKPGPAGAEGEPEPAAPTGTRWSPGPETGGPPPEVPRGDAGARPSPAPSAGELLRTAVAERLPPTLRGARVNPAGRGWRALAVVAVLAAVVSAGLWWHARSVPTVVPTPAVSSVPAAASSAAGSASSSPAQVVVDVSGKVREPGLVRLPSGSRVQDAIRAAGGLKHGAKDGGLNLARELVDGEQVVVGKPPPAGASPPAGGGSPSAAPVDLNVATLDQLETLPGVGPVLGQRIIDYRTAHGGFQSVEQLQDISGIGEKTYADLAPRVRV